MFESECDSSVNQMHKKCLIAIVRMPFSWMNNNYFGSNIVVFNVMLKCIHKCI